MERLRQVGGILVRRDGSVCKQRGSYREGLRSPLVAQGKHKDIRDSEEKGLGRIRESPSVNPRESGRIQEGVFGMGL